MLVDDSIVLDFLNKENHDCIKNHWVFQNINRGIFLFETPDCNLKDEINKIHTIMKSILLNFTPLNESIYSALYPNWKSITSNLNILLVVGCPEPYDALVRTYNNKEYIIFDLIRFYEYSIKGHNINTLVKKLITHETSHICLHEKYPSPLSNAYIDKMKYIIFDESFAHLLSFKDNIKQIDFSTYIDEHYNRSFTKLKDALQEKNPLKQDQLLIESNCGSYWSKYASVSGKLFLSNHLDNIVNIYNNGISNFISLMGL
ncbi:hypothetical protein PV797_16825 [Clostridiaceae bacterium M8S5]|nr:hypothetical protein PV797_16825 [Clostridiaceae bacterium M8S5]